jgi:threonine aldolase
MAHCERGDEYIVGQLAHTYRYEGGGAAVLGSIQPQPLAQGPSGEMALADITGAIKPDDCHFARSRLLCLENTWNGHPMSMGYLSQATGLARAQGLATHLDGARLFNAAVELAALDAQGLGSDMPLAPVKYRQAAINPGAIVASARSITSHFDSASVCFSKGLGAPVGSALCGSAALIARAHRIRKMAGGGMRQSGLLAAAAIYALDHHIDRLADDHALAQRLALGLQGIQGLSVRSAQTNIVFMDVANGLGPNLLAYLKDHGVLATGLIGLRFVTHLDIDRAGIDHTVDCVQRFFKDQAPTQTPPPAPGVGVY